MNKIQRFWSHEAKNIRCVRESDYDALHAEAEALDALCQSRFDEIAQLKADAEALRAENGRLRPLAEDRDQQYDMKVKAREQRDEMHTRLEAARGLLRKWLDTDLGASSATINRLKCSTDYLLTATPAPEVPDHLRDSAKMAEQGERQEVVCYQFQGRDGEWYTFMNERHYQATVEDGSWPVRALYTTPQPGPDVRGLIEAASAYLNALDSGAHDYEVKRARHNLRHELAAHRQAQRQA